MIGKICMIIPLPLTVLLHNYGVFSDTKNTIDNLVNGHPYFIDQMVDSNIVTIIKIVENMVIGSQNGGSAKQIYRKNRHVIDRVSHRLFNETLKESTHDYF